MKLKIGTKKVTAHPLVASQIAPELGYALQNLRMRRYQFQLYFCDGSLSQPHPLETRFPAETVIMFYEPPEPGRTQASFAYRPTPARERKMKELGDAFAAHVGMADVPALDASNQTRFGKYTFDIPVQEIIDTYSGLASIAIETELRYRFFDLKFKGLGVLQHVVLGIPYAVDHSYWLVNLCRGALPEWSKLITQRIHFRTNLIAPATTEARKAREAARKAQIQSIKDRQEQINEELAELELDKSVLEGQ